MSKTFKNFKEMGIAMGRKSATHSLTEKNEVVCNKCGDLMRPVSGSNVVACKCGNYILK